MLHIAYFSNTSENTHRFVQRLMRTAQENDLELRTTRLSIKGEQPTLNEDYILIAPSYGTDKNGHVPPQVKKFLADETSRNHCAGVIGAGNLNFGDEYAASGEIIAAKLQVPLLHKIELSGRPEDTAIVFKLASLTKNQIKEISEKNQKGKA